MADHTATLLEGLAVPSRWDLFLEHEPGDPRAVKPHQLGDVALAFANYADQKSAFTHGHSRQVASLAFRASEALHLEDAEREELRLAALLHDIGRAAIPTGLWDAPRRLTAEEFRQVQAHSYQTEAILAQAPMLRPLVDIASSAHERCEGRGYHRRVKLADPRAALLAAADVYSALTHDRPWRDALAPDAAADAMLQEVAGGRLPGVAVAAVLDAAGQRRRTSEAALPAGLTQREAEVLSLLARGCSNKEMAARLGISSKTIEHHVQHIYEKTGARGRAAAALFAMEQGTSVK